MRVGELQPGDYFSVWHSTFEGAKPQSDLHYGRVTKQNRATTWIRSEHGDHKKVENQAGKRIGIVRLLKAGNEQ